MQFIKNGPDIPERLLQAHEDGRVVFFCGAGISYPAGLPGFEGLVEKLYTELGEQPNPIEKAAIKARQFDTAIGQLEDRIGSRHVVREQLAKVLTPNLPSANAISTQEALLTLAKEREGRYRLVTTNFDRLFEEVINAKRLGVTTYEAPLLPVPKNRWDGLVYLHGLLPEKSTPGALDRLVASSGDFGLAYLSERWAARFVSELFRNFTVCFVGYSINDPVLRYMMDALAADRLLGESSPEMFAFGGSKRGQEELRANEWRAKNVTPILYWEAQNHSILHKTLQSWADVYRNGVLGKERIVVQYAATRPVTSTKQDNFVGRMLWALCDKRALPAKRFADHDPAPSLDWLKSFSEFRFKHRDLTRFGVTPDVKEDESLEFSIVRRPCPYSMSPLMSLVGYGYRVGQWDPVMYQLARWLLRHMHDPELILWIARQGGQVDPKFGSMISDALNENPLPPMMKTLWGIVISRKIRTSHSIHDLYEWRKRFLNEGMTSVMRMELREILSPRVVFREPFRMWDTDETERVAPFSRIRDIVNWEIVVATDHAHSTLADVRDSPSWRNALPDLLSDATALLRDAMDLMRELGGADDLSDLSYIHQPSISSHPQNRAFHDWTSLIELVRDAWLETAIKFPESARLAVANWAGIRYPVFRRLALFAAAQDQLYTPLESLEILMRDQCWWLWSLETQREALRLLVMLSTKLSQNDLLGLEHAILQGPPIEMFRDDIEDERLQNTIDHMIWLRLAKAQQAGAQLSGRGLARIQEFMRKFPNLKLEADERDEFASWIGTGNEWRRFVVAPKTRSELLDWLQVEVTDRWQEDDWRERCRDHFGAALTSLIQLSRAGKWPIERWRQALQAWAEEALVNRSWRFLATTLDGAPEHAIDALAQPLAWWLRSLAKSFNEHDSIFLNLVARILSIKSTDNYEPDDDPVFRAINHPVGQVTEAVLDWWYRRPLEDFQGLPVEIKPLLTELCDKGKPIFRHGRVILATNLISLFRVDPEWAQAILIPHFQWTTASNEDAKAVWEGFLWSPRLYRPLLEVIKGPMLDAAEHYDELGKHHEQYVSYLTYAALEPDSPFSRTEMAKATHSLPANGLNEAAQALARAMEGVGEQREEYWETRIQPYLKAIWPKSRSLVTKEISASFARITIATGSEFPNALNVLRNWLGPIDHPDYLVTLLDEAKLCEQFPETALEFLALIVGDTNHWPPGHLINCLRDIRKADLALSNHNRFIELAEYLRRFKPDEI